MKKTPLRAKKCWNGKSIKVSNKSPLKRQLGANKGVHRGIQSLAKLKKELWKWFSKYIRLRDKNTCFICGRKCEGSGYHAGHFIPKSVGGLTLYFHEENVHGCCYHCNINLGGNLYEYGMKLGKEKCDELYLLKRKTTKLSVEDYLTKIEYYKKLVLSSTK